VQVAEIYLKYLAVAGFYNMHFGPAHVVWEDENFECAESCIEYCDKREFVPDHCTEEQLAAVRQSLVELSELPDDLRYAEPADYDGEHPENYPPTTPVMDEADINTRRIEIMRHGANENKTP
jgi:hypothetical protein